ncbi:MAG: efflux RND transporter periplasmic adaptor subunit [Holosporaceae bacterium]|nr:efflux RND transporter periplasmic adaptor subunit [Holosporaceae bacterium]
MKRHLKIGKLLKLTAAFKQKKVIVGTAIVFAFIVVAGFLFYRWRNKEEVKFKFEPPSVTASSASFGPVSKYVHAIGTLRASDSVMIKSEVLAQIKKICVSEGAIVKEGDVLIELDDTQAKAQLMEAKAQLQKAQAESEPIEKLADKGVVARLQSVSKKAEVDAYAARVMANKNLLERHTIRAPFDGIIGLLEVSKGQLTSQGSELIKVVSRCLLKVDFKIAEAEIEKVAVGQDVHIFVGGDNEKAFSAKIVAIDPECDKVSHTFDVRGVLDMPEDGEYSTAALRPGRFVRVQVPLDGEQRGIVIPESALEKIGDEYVVYRVVEGRAIRTIITVGSRRDGNVEIITGLSEGDLVITSGQAGVLDGKEVKIQDRESTSDIVKRLREAQLRSRTGRKRQ